MLIETLTYALEAMLIIGAVLMMASTLSSGRDHSR
jgi:hypothetical protein